MANGKLWTKVDVNLLYSLAETHSQQQAAIKLGRSIQAVQTKARYLGIKWRQGTTSLTSLATEISCSENTVRRMVGVLFHRERLKTYGSGNGKRFLLTQSQLDRVRAILIRMRKVRAKYIAAGRKSNKSKLQNQS